MTPGARLLLAAAALSGFSGVVLAAIGAHAVQGDDVFATWRSWQAANAMHLLHAPALLALAGLAQVRPSLIWLASGASMLAGTIMFSGSIYTSILTQGAGAGVIAPTGGFTMMLGWLLLLSGLWLRPGSENTA